MKTTSLLTTLAIATTALASEYLPFGDNTKQSTNTRQNHISSTLNKDKLHQIGMFNMFNTYV